MSADAACLVLCLEGPLQSWGTTSQFNRRLTDLFPSRSAITGLLCAALGFDRGSKEECDFLMQFRDVQMLAVAIPKRIRDKEVPVRRLEDYHTVRDTPKAAGGIKDCHITYRHYLLDAAFRVFLTGERKLLERQAQALQDPVWGIWLGRKCCIPSTPVFAGLFESQALAVAEILHNQPLESFAYVEDVPAFSDGEDNIPDMPCSFAQEARKFALRRIVRHQRRSSNAS